MSKGGLRGKNGLRAGIEGNDLVIRIGVDALKNAAEYSEAFNPFNDTINDFRRAFKIRGAKQFAQGVALFLMNEDAEDGSSGLTRLIDKAFESCIENDCGVDEAPRHPVERTR